MPLTDQIMTLFVLALPVACIAWTVTHEEVFREPREYCVKNSREGKTLARRKFFYLFTCEYCFSHYVSLGAILVTGYCLLLDDWRGYVISWFSLVWVANFYMTVFAILRQELKKDKAEIRLIEKEAEGLPDTHIAD